MDTRPVSPWWRHGMVWLVVSGPAAVVVAGIATLVIAVTHPDPVLKTIETPAVQARNHAAEQSPKLAPLASAEGNAGRSGRPAK